MLTSTEISSAAKIVGEERAVEYCAKAGFDAWDFSMFRMCKYDWSNQKMVESKVLEFEQLFKGIEEKELLETIKTCDYKTFRLI